MSNNKKTEVEISLYACNLKNVAGLGKGISDPYAIVTLLAGSADEQPQILGRTEVIKNSLNPSWATTITTEYSFGQESRINVSIFDEIRKSKTNKSMGSAQFEIGEILGSKGNIKARKLKHGGTLFVRVTKASKIDLGSLVLGLRGVHLKNVDGLFSKSDPFFVVESYAKGKHGGRKWLPVYRSEVMKNNLNPEWQECEISIQKLCGGDKEQPVQICVYDWEKVRSIMQKEICECSLRLLLLTSLCIQNGKHNSMGKCQTSINGLLAAGSMSTAFELIRKGKSKKYGKVMVTKATISGQQLDPTKPPPKFATVKGIRQINPDYKRWQANFGAQHQSSSTTQSSQSPRTPDSIASAPETFRERPALGNDKHHTSMPVGASADFGERPSLGEGTKQEPSVSAMHFQSTLSFDTQYPLPPAIPPPGLPPSPMPSECSLSPKSVASDGRPRFVDYISGGTEINLTVAIDFTGSNGDPTMPGTLHYIHKDGQLNDYEKALTAVGSVVARYDNDQKFPVYGFGAKFGGVIQHCFQVGNAAELQGIAGIIEGYRGVFASGLTMSGPTVFAEVIQTTATLAASQEEENRRTGKQCYSILLILTDGALTDIEQTKKALRYASTTPLSIIIVGVGDADFSKMKFLDDFHKEEADVRDIVTFVEFNQYRDNKQALTRETLDEIPDQLVDYFYSNGINPLPPLSDSSMSIYAADYDASEDVDLDFVEGPGGEMTLGNSSQGRWDAASYGKAAGFLPPPMQPPSFVGSGYRQPSLEPAMQSPSSYEPHGYGSGYHQASQLTSMQSPSNPGQVYHNPSIQPPYSNTSQQYHYTNPQTSSSPNQRVPVTLRVTAPPNSYPGMQIRVLNPQTGEYHTVAIPSGVHAGTDFRLNL
eukprot:scaffold925_cov129-Cylindrotheca_fusiformis.AAC.32